MKIALVGTCQVVGMAEIMRGLLPDAQVDRHHVMPHLSNLNEIADTLPSYDYVITQILPYHNMPFFTQEGLREKNVPRVEVIPPLFFYGFHPDAHFLYANGKAVESPIKGYHSKILGAAFLLGLPLPQALALFNRFVFKRLGYLTCFDVCRTFLLNELKQYGYADVFEKHWNEWMSLGEVFMHTPTHPKKMVLIPFVKCILRRAGLLRPEAESLNDFPDLFEQYSAWPLFPEIAEEVGLNGNYVFRTYRQEVQKEEDRFFDLAVFAARSYEIYSQVPLEEFEKCKSIINTRDVLKEILHQV